MTIYFDMDGTLADFYGVDNWLSYLQQEFTYPYDTARPLVNMSLLARYLNKAQKNGIKIGIISWLSKNGSESYNMAVSRSKMIWLKKHLKSVNWDTIKIVPYGIPKQTVINDSIESILFDDEKPNRDNWDGISYDVNNIIEIVKSFAL